jgi:ribosomal protein S18 acetylase RimI-like enzyme
VTGPAPPVDPLLDEVRRLELTPGHFVLFGSAPLLVRGIVPPSGDIDIVARGPAWADAQQLGATIRLMPYDVDVVRLLGGRIEIGTVWGIGDVDVDELIDTAELIDGLPFAALRHVRAYKQTADRAKDREHLRLLDAWEARAGSVDLRIEDPESPDARWCIESYFATLHRRFDAGFDPAASIRADAEDLTLPRGLLVLARRHGRPIGCGALKLHDRDPAEIKRMWVAPEARGLGLGRRLLAELERQAAIRGATVARLETNRSLAEAVALYRSAGYVEVPAFNDEPYAHHWFEKRLPG